MKVHPPAGDRLAIAFRVESSKDCVLFAPLDHLASDARHSSDMGSMKLSMKHRNWPPLIQLTSSTD